MMKSHFVLNLRAPRSRSAFPLLTLAVAVFIFGPSNAFAETDESLLEVTAETKMTAEKAENALSISTYKLESAKRATERAIQELGEDHPKVARFRRTLETMSTIHKLREALIPLLVGERDEEKQAEITRLVKELESLTDAFDEQIEQVKKFNAEETALKARSERDKAQHARQLAAMNRELEQAKQHLAMSRNELQKTSQQLAKQERDRALPPLENAELKIFALQSLPAANAAEAIETLFGAGAIRVALDDRTNSLIVLGKQDSLHVIEALLTNLDQKEQQKGGKKQTQAKPTASRSLLLRLFWLADGLPNGEGSDPAEILPASVLGALKKLGLNKPRLVTQTVNSLSASGNNATEFDADVPALLQERETLLQYGGKLTLAESDQPALAMHVHVQGNGMNCQLNGSLAMPLGHYMVLGTANSVIPQLATVAVAADVGGPGDDAREGAMGMRGEGEFGRRMGGMGSEQPQKPIKFNTSRFAFVVQVIGAESFPPEEKE